MANQREFTRVPVGIYAELRVGGNRIIHGELVNVSFKGLLLQCDVMLPEQTPCGVFLYVNGQQSGPSIEAQGLVVHSDPHTIVVQFMELVGQESAQHLRRLVLYNSGTQADHVEEEFDTHMGL